MKIPFDFFPSLLVMVLKGVRKKGATLKGRTAIVKGNFSKNSLIYDN